VTTPESYHEFFAAAAGVAGALVGLLFVAVSVTMERMEEQGETQIHRIRAATALTAFSNALVVSLFALIPGVNLGWPAFWLGVVGALFVIGALLSMFRLGLRRPAELRGAVFLIGLIVVLVFQFSAGLRLINDHGAYETISILVVVCFVIGVSRSWELIGGPSIGIFHEVFVFGRAHKPGAATNGAEGHGSADAGPSDAGDSDAGFGSGRGSGPDPPVAGPASPVAGAASPVAGPESPVRDGPRGDGGATAGS
jgi:hypothetical protein